MTDLSGQQLSVDNHKTRQTTVCIPMQTKMMDKNHSEHKRERERERERERQNFFVRIMQFFAVKTD